MLCVQSCAFPLARLFDQSAVSRVDGGQLFHMSGRTSISQNLVKEAALKHVLYIISQNMPLIYWICLIFLEIFFRSATAMKIMELLACSLWKIKEKCCFVFMSLKHLAHKNQIYCCTYRDCSYTLCITDGTKYVICLLVMCNCFYSQRSQTSQKMLK